MSYKHFCDECGREILHGHFNIISVIDKETDAIFEEPDFCSLRCLIQKARAWQGGKYDNLRMYNTATRLKAARHETQQEGD